MPARLIIHADDFGLTPGINRSVVDLFRAGALSSASLMATAPFAAEAASMARQHPGLGVGCHLTFVDGVPAADPARIRSLLGADGRTFRTSLPRFVLALLRGQVRAEDLACEAEAQIRQIQSMEIAPTHLDTHKHLHVFPMIARTVLRSAERCGIRAVRNPFEPRWSQALAHASWSRRMQMRWLERYAGPFGHFGAVREGRVRTTAGTLGIAATGTLTAETLRSTVQAAAREHEESVFELCCHPAYLDDALRQTATRLRATRAIEHAALLDVVPEIVRSAGGPALIHYGELAPTNEPASVQP